MSARTACFGFGDMDASARANARSLAERGGVVLAKVEIGEVGEFVTIKRCGQHV